MNNPFTLENDNTETPSVCLCNDTGIYYPCSKCGKYHNDELDALLCCLDN